jgi:hypothetical protein
VLARKTESYSKSVEEALAKKNGVPQLSEQESAVQWIKPGENPKSSAAKNPPADDSKPMVKPAIGVKTKPSLSADQVPTEIATSTSRTEANIPAAAPPPHEIDQTTGGNSLDPFEAKLSKRVKDYPRDISAQLEYQLWLFLRDQSVPQLATLSSLPSEDRELIAALMDALTNFRNQVRADNNMLLSKKIHPLIDLADRLRTQADLAIPKALLCSKVMGFGQYDAIEARFTANGKEPEAILYCEVENFSSQLNAEQWSSELKLESVLYSEGSPQVLQVWADKSETVKDSSRNRRHDFFLRKRITLPKTLSLGRYLLKVSITDVQANRIAETTLPIEVVAQ